MFLAYFDETYEKRLEHSVVALMLPVSAIPNLEKRLEEIVRKAHNQHPQIPANAELHGYELSNGQGDWADLSTPRSRIRVYREAIEAIATSAGAQVCIGSIDLAKRNPHDAHSWSLTFVLERVDRAARILDTHVIGICDDVQNKSIYQDMYAKSRRYGTKGAITNNLSSFTDGLHFTPSHHSRLVQAVDLVAYVYRRNFIVPYDDPRAAKAFSGLWDTIACLMPPDNVRKW